jgi:phosphatidylethanolamine/phosphatidyl-N-methylethanolamine N-methyltransferase
MEKMNKNAEFVFFSKWLKSPLSVASVTPSSTQLAKAMASGLPDNEGLVIELGGGTGPITHALLEAGVRPDHLVVIERDPHFHRYLQQRFPGINVVCGDALRLTSLMESLSAKTPTRAVVSGLPLLSMNAVTQKQLLKQSMYLTGGKGPFIQFSYSLSSPVKKTVEKELGLVSHCVAQVWRNVPPAKVWMYERNEAYQLHFG